jgi:hypothetical protein
VDKVSSAARTGATEATVVIGKAAARSPIR